MARRRGGVTGVKETAAAMRRLASLVAGPGNQAAKRTLAPTLEAARRFVPVDDGELRDSLQVRRVKGSPKLRPKYVVAPDPASPARSRAHIAEFGREAGEQGGRFKGTRHPGHPGTAFMTKAFESTRLEAVKIFGREFGPALEKQVARRR